MGIMWLASFGRVLDPSITSWGDFMQVTVRVDGYQTSSMHTIPFIHVTPSDMSTLYTALLFAEEQCRNPCASSSNYLPLSAIYKGGGDHSSMQQ